VPPPLPQRLRGGGSFSLKRKIITLTNQWLKRNKTCPFCKQEIDKASKPQPKPSTKPSEEVELQTVTVVEPEEIPSSLHANREPLNLEDEERVALLGDPGV
jgi:hypothetical protein